MRRIREESVELAPVAILSMAAEGALAGQGPLDADCDGLGEWVGAAYVDDEGTEYALRQYAGHPKGSCTVYLSLLVDDPAGTRAKVVAILGAHGIDRCRVAWERGDAVDMADWRDAAGRQALPPAHRAG